MLVTLSSMMMSLSFNEVKCQSRPRFLREVLDYFGEKQFFFFHFLKRKENETHIYSEFEMQERDRQCAYLYDFISLGNFDFIHSLTL